MPGMDTSEADNFPTGPEDEFHLDQGVKSDFDGVIEDAWFGTTQNAGNLLFCFLKIKADDGEEVERRFTCGDDWASYDGGVTAEHPTKKHFNTQSNYGRFIAAAMSLAEADLRQRSKELENAGPRNAKLWVGFKFHWVAQEESGTLKDRTTGEDRAWRSIRLLPTQLVNVGEGAAAPSGGTQPEQGTADAGDPLSGVDQIMRSRIKLLAKENDYPSFVDGVMGLPGVVENATLMVALGDESFYETLRSDAT